MRIGMCTGLDSLADAATAGYDYAELPLANTIGMADEAEYARMRAKIQASPLPVAAFNCFLPGDLKVTGPAVDLGAVEQYVTTALQRAAEVGASFVVFGSAGSRAIPEGFPVERAWEQLAEAARLSGEIAVRNGLTIVMEPLSQCQYFQRVEQGIAFVDRVQHPGVKLLGDLFHVATIHESFEHLIAAGDRLAHIHLATPIIAENREQTFDFTGFLATLARAGYQGRISVEDNPGLLAGKQPPFTQAYRAMRQYVVSCLPPEWR